MIKVSTHEWGVRSQYAMWKNDEELEGRLMEYCIGKNLIYVTFSWSCAEEGAYDNLSKKHGVCFFDASGSGDIIYPDRAKLK